MHLYIVFTSIFSARFVGPMLLSLGLVFSVATQLRIAGLPFGLGEMLLLLWLAAALREKHKWYNQTLMAVLCVFLMGALLLGAGRFLGAYPAGLQRPAPLHDVLAYTFCAVLAISYARLADKYEDSLPVFLLGAFAISTLLALVLGVLTKNWSGVDAIYYHTRWQHLSNNPNQFALLVLILPFLSIHLMLRRPADSNSLYPALLGVLSLALGWYSQSNALTLAWIGGGLVAMLALLSGAGSLKAHTHDLGGRLGTRNRRIVSCLLVLMVVGSAWQWRTVAREVAVVVDAGAGPRIGAGAGAGPRIGAGAGAGPRIGVDAGTCSTIFGLRHTSADVGQGQVSVRLALWCNALGAIQHAPLTGMGPGGHSGLATPFEGEEAHNTLLDWGTQAGLLGIAGLVIYLAWLLWQVARKKDYELIGMVLGLYCFAMFHFVLRQPLFWIVPLLSLQLALRSGTSDSDTKLTK